MRLVQENNHSPGTMEIRWMWLPTFIGQNIGLIAELDKELTERFPPPFPLSNTTLELLHRYLIDQICNRVKIEGLRQYLEAVANVEE